MVNDIIEVFLEKIDFQTQIALVRNMKTSDYILCKFTDLIAKRNNPKIYYMSYYDIEKEYKYYTEIPNDVIHTFTN